MLSKRLLSSLYRVKDGKLISKFTGMEVGQLDSKGKYVIIFDEQLYVNEIIQILERNEE